jgi:glycine/D-amino acid oxidase-like deaminating enzyme
MVGVDAVVVGNGALGLFLADELACRGVGSVALVGPPNRLAGASRAAGAMLGCFGEVTKDTMRTPASRAKFAVGLAARKRWPSVLERLGVLAAEQGETLHHVPDTFVLLNACGGELDSLNFTAMLAVMDEFGEPWSEADAGAIRAYQPRTDARALRIVHLPDEGAVDGNQVLSLMDTQAVRSGVRTVPEQVVSIVVSGGKATGVRLADGDTISAGVVVVAAGVASAPLLHPVLRRNELMPLYAGAGVAFVGNRVQGEGFGSVVRSPNRSGSCGIHLVPLRNGLEYVGATNILFERPQHQPYLGVTRFLGECAMQQLDERICFHDVMEWRTGNRPVTFDGFPLVGWTSVPGLYLLTGTYRDGFHCAPVLAEHVTSQILGHDGTLNMPFAPDREPIASWTVEESVEEFVLHMEAGLFEARASLPSEVNTAALREIYRAQGRAMYSVLPGDFGLNPEILMYLNGALSQPGRVMEISRYLRARTAGGQSHMRHSRSG